MSSVSSRCLTAVALTACSGSQTATPAPTAAPPASETTAVRESPASTSEAPAAPAAPAAATAPSDGGKCVAKGDVSRGGITWPLRTRPDTPPAMTIEDGTVTAWLGAHGKPWSVAAEVENGAMKIRAFVSGEDLRFFVTKPFFVRTGWVPDGITERKVVDATDTHVSLEIAFDKLHTTVFEVPCGELGVMPARIDAEPLLARGGGEVVLKPTAPVLIGGEKLSASSFSTPDVAERPAGTLATERGPRESGPNQRVSIETCGGTALGEVSKADLVGQPRTKRSSSAPCPGAPSGKLEARPPLTKALACASSLPLFLRSATLEDPVGTLKAGARIQVEGHEEKGTTLILVRNPAVAPAEGASFAVKTGDLAACTPAT